MPIILTVYAQTKLPSFLRIYKYAKSFNFGNKHGEESDTQGIFRTISISFFQRRFEMLVVFRESNLSLRRP